MGLDMYIYAEKYFSNYDYLRKSDSQELRDEVVKYEKVMHSIGLDPDQYGEGNHLYVELCVAQFRKVNAVHRWFVDNVADGVDDCKPMYVDRGQLEELRNQCYKVLGDDFDGVEPTVSWLESFTPTPEMVDRAKTYLPTQGGFFFGGTEYSSWYFYYILDTVGKLNKILDNEDLYDVSFYYQASW